MFSSQGSLRLGSLMLLLFISTLLFSQEQYAGACLTQHPAHDRYASYSPAGSSITFESDRNGNWDIFIVNADGSNQQPLTLSSATTAAPTGIRMASGS